MKENSRILFTLFLICLSINVRGDGQPEQITFSPGDVVYAQDCGNLQESYDQSGNYYLPDLYYFTSDSTTLVIKNYELNSVQYTLNPYLYFTSRISENPLGYRVSIQHDGFYTLCLMFCEFKHKEVGRRIMQLKLGDRYISEIDIVDQVGHLAAYNEYIQFEIRGQQVYFKGELAQKAYLQEKKSVVIYLQRNYNSDMVKLDGLVLTAGKLSDSSYPKYIQLQNNWAQIDNERAEQEKADQCTFKRKVNYEDDEDNQQETIFLKVTNFLFEPYVLITIGVVGLVLLQFFGKSNNKETKKDQKNTNEKQVEDDKKQN